MKVSANLLVIPRTLYMQFTIKICKTTRSTGFVRAKSQTFFSRKVRSHFSSFTNVTTTAEKLLITFLLIKVT